MKRILPKPQTLLMPLPAALVSCRVEGEKANIITISWIGIVNSKPPMLSISVAPQRYSHRIIKEAGEFVVNLTSEANQKAADFCGTKSGRDHDKFEALGLTPLEGKVVKAPIIKECPINLECQVRHSYVLGSHEMFVSEIVATHVDEELLNRDGGFDIDRMKPLAYCPVAREYRGGLSVVLGHYGRSERKKKPGDA